MGRNRTRTEPWETWYPKARAAYKQLTPESTNEEIATLYQNVGPTPDRTLYVGTDIGTFNSSSIELIANCVFETLRQFKKAFGDSEKYLAVISLSLIHI